MHDPLAVAFEIRRPWPRRMRSGGWYWPPLVTVWHREPGGADSGQVCKWFRRTGERVIVRQTWRLHVHHWRIQVHPLQALRRQLLTRCAWCGGRQAKGDPINIGHQWDRSRGRWWQGEPGLYHHDCSSVARAHRLCVCASPVLIDKWSRCARCDKPRTGRSDGQVERDRILAAVPEGQRDRTAYDRVCAMWAAERESTV